MAAPYASEEKRTELVRAATRLLHEQGFHRTTLADVAGTAKVPLGNVYYYFKTKEALAEAVIASHEAALRECFASWTAAHRDPKLRLRCLVRAPMDAANDVIQFGCPHGSLCQELEKLVADAPLAKAGRHSGDDAHRAHHALERDARATTSPSRKVARRGPFTSTTHPT
jgi:AcrR family transcriptional regulator